MFKKKTLISSLICGLALILLAIPCMISFYSAKNVDAPIVQPRTTSVELSNQEINYESILKEFDNGKLETNDSLTTFEGYQTINLSDLEEIDNLSESNLEEASFEVKYNFSYDSETNIVTLSATSMNELGVIEVDEIQGIAFTSENGKLDALLDIDGEYVLLSELQDAGLIENCGWFKKLWKKVVVAVVATVVVAAAVTAIVATAGAGLGACIAAGAVAGGVTGGIAGGVISYQETGEVEVWAVVGGIIGGAALGGLTGWAVGAIMGAGTKMTCGFAKGSFDSVDDCLNYHFNKHGAEVGAKNISEYVKLAEQTAHKVVKNGLPAIRQVSGATANVFRYEVGNYYIHMAKSAKEIIIVSFGLLL